MTEATFKLMGNSLEVDISGHSMADDGGPNIVCASCSTLAFTLHQEVSALYAHGAFTRLHCKLDEKAGRFWCSADIPEESAERVGEAISTIIGGFALLQKKYPDKVKLMVTSGEK